jgi:hypothetical protein
VIGQGLPIYVALEPVDMRLGYERLGGMLARPKLSSAHAVDAFVVATALQFEAAVIATGEPADIRRLAAPFSRVGVLAL